MQYKSQKPDRQGCVSLIDRNDKFDRLIHCSLIEINQFDLDNIHRMYLIVPNEK